MWMIYTCRCRYTCATAHMEGSVQVLRGQSSQMWILGIKQVIRLIWQALFIGLAIFNLFCEYEAFVCICKYITCIPIQAKREYQINGTGIIDVCDPPGEC